MLSNHELVTAFRDDLYPKIKEIENQCLNLFNKQLIPGRGPTGQIGTNELAFSIGLLLSSAAMLNRVAKEQNIEIPDFEGLTDVSNIKAACHIMDSACASPEIGLYDWQKEAWKTVRASLIPHVKLEK